MAALTKTQEFSASVTGIQTNKYFRSNAPADDHVVVAAGAGCLANVVGYDDLGTGFYFQIWDGAAPGTGTLLFEFKVAGDGAFSLPVPLQFSSGLSFGASSAQGVYTATTGADLYLSGVWYNQTV